MKKLPLLFLFFFVAGCSSIDQQVFKARQTFDKYPNEAAKYCGDKFPVADSTISVKIDTVKGKTIDYTPALANLQTMLDSAKTVLYQKQSNLTGMAGQLSFTKTQLGKADVLINNLTAQIASLKSSYKPCQVDTIRSTYTKIRSNIAKIMALTAQIVADDQDKQKSQNALQDEKTTAAHRLYLIIGLCLLITTYFGIKVYKFFIGGAIAGIAKKLI